MASNPVVNIEHADVRQASMHNTQLRKAIKSAFGVGDLPAIQDAREKQQHLFTSVVRQAYLDTEDKSPFRRIWELLGRDVHDYGTSI